MIRMVLLNLIIAGLYLWACENNRIICLYLWFLAPFLNLILWSFVEKKLEERQAREKFY